MKKMLFAAAMLLCHTYAVYAKNGYHISLRMPGVTDSVVYLAHYYGKGRPTIFKTDSARIDKRGNAELRSTSEDFTGGIYIVYLSDLLTNFEVLLNKGDDITIVAPKNAIPNDIEFKGSPENTRFAAYVRYLNTYSAGDEVIRKEFEMAKTAGDTAEVRAKAKVAADKLKRYREDYAAQYPGTLLAKIFKAMELPVIQDGDHYLADGKTKDSTFAYRQYKAHYWDGFDLTDDRLIYTPLYDSRLEEYFNKLVVPYPDSLKHEADMLLARTKGTKDMFHYTLWWLTRYAENSKVMGLDEVFVHLVENYYMKGDAFWLKPDELKKYTERARKIAPNVLGNMAPPISLPDVRTGKTQKLYDIQAKYTMVVFYSPTCGHCRHEVPLLDSVYEAVLKHKGIQVYSVATEEPDSTINKFLKEQKLDKKWMNTWDPQRTGDWHDKYDVYVTPSIYLLDEKKIIRGKRLDHTNVAGLVEMLEKKQKSGSD
ncbi:MAG: redoxin domain-containing protein [Chitinophagaceae bacterium]|nr:redoxin domain-containing protein [Chitinophagaceae bacterium]